MGTATVVALKARAYQVSHLCFNSPGIIDSLGSVSLGRMSDRLVDGKIVPFLTRPIQLGDPTTAFNFDGFYAGLSKTSATDNSQLVYNSTGILNDPKVQASMLMKQRGAATAALLDKGVSLRQNSYYAKYQNQDQIISVMKNFYKATAQAPSSAISKPDLLVNLRNVSDNQMNDLTSAYGDGLLPTLPDVPSVVTGTGSKLQTSGQFPDTTQTITNTDFTYRTPIYEAQAQGWRADISLMDQQFAQFLKSQNLPHLKQVFQNELAGIDLDVKRLQIAYLNTLLMSPVAGTITGIYKNPGDWVQAGEPVMRVEDNTTVVLAGTLVYQGPIAIGSQITVTTSLYDSQTSKQAIGTVVSVRGRPNEDDRWDVHAICDNSTTPALPLNYSFDYDDTSIIITP